MGKDVKWYDYFKDNRRYADIINAVACKVAMGVDFAIIGIENQDEIDYELLVRIMEYDVTRYRQQIAAINKAVREVLRI